MKQILLSVTIILCLATVGTLSVNSAYDHRMQNRVTDIPVGPDNYLRDRISDDKNIMPDYYPKAALRQDSILEYISSSLWLGVQDILVDNDFAYCAFINGLVIFDVSDSSLPVMISEQYINGGAREVFKLGSLLYLAGEQGLTIIDVTLPGNPAIVGERPVTNGINGLFVRDGLACAITSNDMTDFIVFDVSVPSAPDSLGSFNTPGLPWDIFVVNDLAYVADDFNGLSIIDISNPADPQLFDSLNIPGISTSVIVNDSLAFVVGDSFWVVNIDLSPPEVVGSLPFEIIPGADCISLDITHEDSLVYVNYMEFFTQFDAHLEIINVADPSNPVRVGLPDLNPTGLFVANSLAYTIYGFPFYIESVDRRRGLEIFDVNDLLCLPPNCPADSNPVGSFGFPFRIRDVDVVGDYAYVVCDSCGLFIMDISDPANPVASGRFSDLSGSMSAVSVSGDLACITYHNGGDHLVTIDVGNPADPVFLDSIETPGFAYEVCVRNTVAYVTDGSPHLTTFDITDPADPFMLDSITVSGHGYGIVVQDSLAYIADYFKGLTIINVADPTDISFVSYSPEAWEARDIFVLDDFAYLTEADYGMHIVDISNPYAPAMRGDYSNAGTNLGVNVQDGRAYVAVERLGLHLVDVTDPDNPVLLDIYDTPGFAGALSAGGGMVYLADYFSLMMLRDNGFPPVLTCGDANADGMVNVGDAVYLISYVFRGGEPPIPDVCTGDVNADGLTNVGDAVYVISYVFRHGAPMLEGCCD